MCCARTRRSNWGLVLPGLFLMEGRRVWWPPRRCLLSGPENDREKGRQCAAVRCARRAGPAAVHGASCTRSADVGKTATLRPPAVLDAAAAAAAIGHRHRRDRSAPGVLFRGLTLVLSYQREF